MQKSFVQKPYSRIPDLQRMLDLVKTRPLERLTEFPSIADLQEMLASENRLLHIRLWEDVEGQLVGFALLQNYQTWAFLVMEGSASCAKMEIREQMVAWGEEIVRCLSSEYNRSLPMEVHLRADEQTQIALVQSLGFERQPGGSVSLARSLDIPIPKPEIPAGFKIRPSAGEEEIEAWVRMHRLAWGTENMTVEERRAMLQTPFYDPALDLVAVAPDGSLAATCVCWYSEEENTLTGRKDGYTDPVATHPAHQRRGLAKALILTGMQLLKARGLQTARMGTSQDNLGMLRTAQSVGFQIVSENLWFSKNIS